MKTEEKEFTQQGIGKTKADDMVKEYAKSMAALTGGNEFTKSAWFSIEALDNIISAIKAERYIRGEEKLQYGVRIYFGRYGQDEQPHNTTSGRGKDYANRNTVLFVSTKQDGIANVNTDYFTQLSTDKIIIDPENRGELCPPQVDCNGSALG